MFEPKLVEFIRGLSAQDAKDLSQRGLKTQEEVGELAKAILPFVAPAGRCTASWGAPRSSKRSRT